MKIVCLGDSNTYGFDPRSYFGGRYDKEHRWVDLLAGKAALTAENYGQNGLSIPCHEYDLPLYDRIISSANADYIIIMLGSNDLLQGLSADMVSKRMERFIKILSVEKEKLLLLSPVVFRPGTWVEDEKLIEQSYHLGDCLKLLAEKLGISFIDTRGWEIPLCYDGVHFTEQGHVLFAESLYNDLFKEN